MDLPALARVISFASAMLVLPKSMPSFAPTRLSTFLSRPATSRRIFPSCFIASNGPLAETVASGCAPRATLSANCLMSVIVRSRSSVVARPAASAKPPRACAASRRRFPLMPCGRRSGLSVKSKAEASFAASASTPLVPPAVCSNLRSVAMVSLAVWPFWMFSALTFTPASSASSFAPDFSALLNRMAESVTAMDLMLSCGGADEAGFAGAAGLGSLDSVALRMGVKLNVPSGFCTTLMTAPETAASSTAMLPPMMDRRL